MPDPKNYDLGYRPYSYWDVPEAMLANVKGEMRRRGIARAIAEGRIESVPEETLGDSLPDGARAAAGAVHPWFMGGEYLPDYLSGEVEVARVALESTTADVMALRARRVGKRIRYRWVDEYGGESDYEFPHKSSVRPLTLGQLIELIDGTSSYGGDPGMSIPLWASVLDGHTPEEAASFARLSSCFYPDLSRWYEDEAAEWIAAEHERLATEGNSARTER